MFTDGETSIRERIILIHYHILKVNGQDQTLCHPTLVFPIVTPFAFLHIYELKDELSLNLTFFPLFVSLGHLLR